MAGKCTGDLGGASDAESTDVFGVTGSDRGLRNEVSLVITLTSKEARNRFGALIAVARKGPVTITNRNRPALVVLSVERYAELEAIEDKVWLAKAKAAEKKGYLSAEESEALVQEMLNAEA